MTVEGEARSSIISALVSCLMEPSAYRFDVFFDFSVGESSRERRETSFLPHRSSYLRRDLSVVPNSIDRRRDALGW